MSAQCDLCGLACSKNPFQQWVEGAERFFCCVGCMNVYLILWESGIIRAGSDLRQTDLFQRSLELGLISNGPDRTVENKSSEALDCSQSILHVSGMWCTSCAWLIEHALHTMPGVVKAEASFASDLVRVQYHPQLMPPQRISECIRSLGYQAEEYTGERDNSVSERRNLVLRTGLAAFLWANVMSFSLVLYAGYFEQISGSVRRGLPYLLMALSTPVVFYCAQPVFNLAFRGLLNRTLRMESLLALGISAAYGYSVTQTIRGQIHLYFDTATVIVTFVLAGKLMERGAKEKVSRWITLLHRMMPNKVRLLLNGSERFVSVDALAPGELFVVKAGERIPADGIVQQGESHTDEALLTGEAIPVGKTAGDKVIAGSINLDGVLRIRATQSARDSTLSRLVDYVERALTERCDLERMVDRVSRVFVPVVIGIAVLTFLFTWSVGNAGLAAALMRAISVLVIACPCALGLATPLAMTAAYGAASQRGCLIRDSRALENLRKVQTVILDKTGTVTEGALCLLEMVSCRWHKVEPVTAGGHQEAREIYVPGATDPSTDDDQLRKSLMLLASIEQYSEHPLGKAVMAYARSQGVAPCDGESVQIHKGSGITGSVEHQEVFAGNRGLLQQLGIFIDEASEERACASELEGLTVAFVGWGGELQALAVFGDRLKEDATELVCELGRKGIDVHLISGDSPTTVRSIASQLGIDHWQAAVLPEQKVETVRQLQRKGYVVAMVGDGINDAPALARADIGIAMKSGTDLAMKAADVVLMSGSLNNIVELLDLSRFTMNIVRQNLFWAFFYNTIGIALAVAGILNPIMAAGAMLISSAFVIGNSLRLGRTPFEYRAGYESPRTTAPNAAACMSAE